MSTKNTKIRHKGTRQERSVTEREWEKISSNPLISYQYEVISKPAASESKPTEQKDSKK